MILSKIADDELHFVILDLGSPTLFWDWREVRVSVLTGHLLNLIARTPEGDQAIQPLVICPAGSVDSRLSLTLP